MTPLENENLPREFDEKAERTLRSFRASRIVLPIVLGLAAVVWLFYRQFDPEQFKTIRWTAAAFGWMIFAAVLLALRHLCYAWRLHTITRGAFSFRKCVKLIVLWEFSAAVTPTSKGAPLVMLFVLSKEKLGPGRTAAAVFYTMLCDSGFFVLLCPLLLVVYGPPMLYPGTTDFRNIGLAGGAFLTTYTMMAIYWLILVLFMFIRPSWARKVLHRFSEFRFLKKYQSNLKLIGHEFELTAAEMKRQKAGYHARVLLATVGAWTTKFLMINCLIIAVAPETPLDGDTQAFIYARLVAMFIIMAFSPTPGGAGLAELALAGFISDYVPTGIGLVVALLWRGMAYYGYLLLGTAVVPGWVNRHFSTDKGERS